MKSLRHVCAAAVLFPLSFFRLHDHANKGTVAETNYTQTFSDQITLVHASCPCTLANPSGTIVAGTAGTIIVKQSATGSDLIGTYGSYYETPGGTSTITLSSGANAVDVLSYYVLDTTHILLVPALNFSH